MRYKYHVVEVSRILQPCRATNSLVGDLPGWISTNFTPRLSAETLPALPRLPIELVSNKFIRDIFAASIVSISLPSSKIPDPIRFRAIVRSSQSRLEEMASTSQNLRKRTPASNTDEATQPMINKPQQAAAHQQPLLLSIDFQPEWYKDNEYIHTGYRPVTNSYLGSLRSFLYIHNETGNIYSHLLAALWMLLLPLIYYPYAKEHYSTANSDDWLVFGLFFLGGFLCYTCSVAYHVFSNHSHAVHDVCLRVDLFGITTVTAGCFPPGMWYTFPCMDRKTRIWWISVYSPSPPSPV